MINIKRTYKKNWINTCGITKCLFVLTAIMWSTTFSAPAIPWIGEPSGPWEELFNGENLDNWEYRASNNPFSVENGILRMEGKDPKTFLIHPKPLVDFEVQITYKLSSLSANGGIQVRSQCQQNGAELPDCGNHAVCGVQLDIAMDHSGKLFEECRSFLVKNTDGTKKCRKTLEVNEWMTTTARLNKDSVSLWLNGVHCLDFRFKQADHIEGEIFALQSHGPFHLIEYNSVKIRELKHGCTDSSYVEFDPDANNNDGSCASVRVGIAPNFNTSIFNAVLDANSKIHFNINTLSGYKILITNIKGDFHKVIDGTESDRLVSLELPNSEVYFIEFRYFENDKPMVLKQKIFHP